MPSFSDYSETYEAEVEHCIRFIGQEADFFTEVKAAEILRAARHHFGATDALHLLDVGCGPGGTDAYLLPHVRSLTGVDPSVELVERAAQNNPAASYVASDGQVLNFEDGSFDVTFAVCVLHHVEPDGWAAFASELARVTRPGGLVMIVEHNPVNPLTRLAVARCAFDDDVVLLGPGRVEALLEAVGTRVVASRYILFFPWRGRVFRGIERYLGKVPLGAQYLTAGTPDA